MTKNVTKAACLFVLTGLLIFVMPLDVKACYYDKLTDSLYCQEPRGCEDPRLETASRVILNTRLTSKGITLLCKNKALKKVFVRDLSNLTQAETEALYPILSKGDISMAAILFSYDNLKSSFGNDGTKLYRETIAKECPAIVTYRSCASVVSAAICASGAADYGSEGTAGLVTYFEGNPDWVNMGKLRAKDLKPGDIIFIDRKSHAAAYQSGAMKDSEFEADVEEEYHGGYDNMGHKNYEEQDPTGSPAEVFCPDQDGDGEVGDWEAEYWRCYWQRVNPGCEIPSYDYYYTWLEEAKEYKAKKAAQAEEAKKSAAGRKKKVIHDHIFVWTGNEEITRVFPENNGNIVSGSYTENYAKARSSAVSTYNFTGDYRIYRYQGKYDQ